ncbi:MAG: TraB/GumN family protein [Oscillospiraceae bacterium]|nr:TraB/GumN family protein [Oscillospiraceae bacterium]
MKNITKSIALVLCIAMLLSMFGCTQKPVEDTAPSTEPTVTEPAPTEPSAEELYATAQEALAQVTDISLELIITTYTTIGKDEFSEQSNQILTYKGIGSEDMVVSMEETLEFSIHNPDEKEDTDEEDEPVTYKEIWAQGNVYAELMNTYRYSGPVDAEELSSRYTPVVLLNAELYSSISSEKSAGSTVISFAEPTAAETWAIPEEGELVESSGSATVNSDGVMEEMYYTVTYTYGPAEIKMEVQSKPMDTTKNIAAPANPDTYTQIECIDALRMTISAPAMLAQADDVTSSGMESLFCQAAGLLRNQSTKINLSGRKEATKAKIDTGVYVMDYSTRKSQEYDQEETFIDGKLTTVVNDGLPSTKGNVTWENIRDYVSTTILAGILDMDFWKDVTGYDLGSVYYLEYQLNDNFGNTMQNNICKMLWNDPSFLYNLASKYENSELNGYLSIDKYTGIPVAAGYYYKGIHTIENQDYELTLQFDQSLEAPAKGAYKEITEKMPEETEPENKATPLFYHVTGENGQEMWLLGTIHVGDERTGFLPKEIYDAFAASDALALECDSEAFDEQMEKDDKLSEQVSNLYFYSNGNSVQSLIEKYEAEHPEDKEETEEDTEKTDDAEEEEEDTDTQVLRLLKATGSYNMNMPYAKPYVWSSSIDEFYLRQGYQLHRDQGVEERLTAWAKELDKEILEVESSLFQIKLLTGFSDDLQLMMLGDAVSTSARESWEATMDLYEKWCAGDEAVLREEINDEVDTSEMTEEELAEYEEYKPLMDEYNKAISIDRNKGMLKKAIEYLESDKVIFYAVGLAHLLDGTNGLVDALREAGYTVELVTYTG